MTGPVAGVEPALAHRTTAPKQGGEGAGREAIDGTPVLDVKPLLGQVAER